MGASLESSERAAPRAGQQSHAVPRALPGMDCLPGMTALMKRTVRTARCSSEGPLARVSRLSTRPSRPFCLREERKRLGPPPKIILSDAAGYPRQEVKQRKGV